MPDKKLSVSEFSAKIKSKYPEYKDVDDFALATKIVEKYPEYGNSVDLKKKEQPISKDSGSGSGPFQQFKPGTGGFLSKQTEEVSVNPDKDKLYQAPKKKEAKFSYNPQSFSQSIKALQEYNKGKMQDIQDFADPRLNELWQQTKQNASNTGADPVGDFATKVLDVAGDLVPTRIKNAWDKGSIQGEQAAIIGTAEEQLTPEQISEISELERRSLEIPESNEQRDFDKGGFAWMFSNPVQGSKFIGELLASSLASQLAASKRTIPAGVGAGALAGSVVPGVGTLAGAATGLSAGIITSSLSLETSQQVLEALRESGFDVKDKESLARGLANGDLIEKAREKGLKRGVPIAIMDIVSAGLGSRLLLGTGSKLAKGAGAVITEGSMGAGGELLAQVSAGEKIRPRDIGLEFIAEVGSGAPSLAAETASQLMSRDKTSASNENIARSIAIDPKDGANDAIRNLNNQLDEGRISEKDYNEGIAFVEKLEKAKTKVPADLNDDVKAESILLVDKKDEIADNIAELEKQKETLDDAFHAPIDAQISEKQLELDNVNKQIQDAVQKQTTSEIPVQPEARVGQEVAEGEPEAEPQTVAKGVEEEVALPSETVEAPSITRGKIKYNPVEQVAVHRETGGSTYRITGENLIGKPAASVSIFPERSQITRKPVTAAMLKKFAKENADILAGNEDVLAVGTWFNSEAGETYLDIVAALPKDEAIKLGKDYNQISVFDLENVKEINTGGTGEMVDGLKPESERINDIRSILGEEKPKSESTGVEKPSDNIASKIRDLKINLGKGALQSNIAGLPIALYNSVLEFVATSVEAGSTVAEAINNAIKRFNLNKFENFDKSELSKNIQQVEKPTKSKSVKDIDVNKIRTQDRPGNRVSKGLSVKTSGGEKVVEESDSLSIEYVKNNAPKVFISNAEKLSQYPIVSGVKKFGDIKTEAQAQEVYDIFIRQVADNLKYLTTEYNPELRDIATLWYDGANMLANGLSERYGVSPEQAAGIIAAMSPQKDWYMNVRLAELVMMAYEQNAVLTDDMISKQIEIAKEGEKPFLKSISKAKQNLAKNRTKANLEKVLDAQKKYNNNKENASKVIEWLKGYTGMDINSVPQEVQPYIIRLHNELNNPKEFNILRPDGEILEVARTKDGSVKKIAWGSYSEIGKAASIYNNGSQENITKSLGEMHKIRNFYNNIIDPMSKDGDVTIDTHAVAAALLQPLSGNSKQVGENFGTGTSNSSPLGIKGLYYAYSDAYALAAKELSLLPRQVQSITWEAVRGLFTDTFKRNVAEVKKINEIWEKYENGEITIKQARELINESAGGVKDPTWAQSILPESEGLTREEPVGGGDGVFRPDAIGESSAVRVAAKAVRKAKINLGKGTAQSNIAGLPIALYNTVIEFIATSIEAGASVAEAIANAVEKYKLREVKGFNENGLYSEISNATGVELNVPSSIKNAATDARRSDYGLEPRKRPSKRTFTTVEDEAKAAIKSGINVYELIDSANSGNILSDVEQAVIGLFMASKENDLVSINEKLEKMGDSSATEFATESSKRDKILDELLLAYDAVASTGTAAARALNSRKMRLLQDYSLAGIISRKRKVKNNQPLTRSELAEAQKTYQNIKRAQDALDAKMAKLNEEQSKLKLKKAIPSIVDELRAEEKAMKRKATKEEILSERQSIKDEISKILKQSRSELGTNKIPVELIPTLAKLAKNYLKEGVVNLDELVDKVHGELSSFIDNLSKADVKRALSNYDKEGRDTKEDLQNKIAKLNQANKKITQSEEASDKSKKAEKAGKELDAEDYKNQSDKLADEAEAIASSEGIDVSDKRLDAYKKRIAKRIEELKGKIDKKDFSKAEKDEIVLDKEAMSLKKELDRLKFEYDVELAKEELKNRNLIEKISDSVIDVMGVPRALMATADFSAPLRQAAVATVSYPKIAKSAAVEMFGQAFNEEKADQWFADLYASPGYQLMKDSGLYIADIKNPKLTAKEEDYTSNLAARIPGIGKVIGGSERAYVGYLNKMRVDIFSMGVELMQNNGKSFATDPAAYKALASYVNSITGRGELPGKLHGAGPSLNLVFFSPRLILSRFRLLTNWLNPVWYFNTPLEVKKMYAKDMSLFISFGLAVLFAFSLSGAEVEDDPRSSDFGKIRYGDTRWDIWAGFQQFVRTIAQAITGEKKSTATGKVKEVDEKERGSIISRFFRSKLAPIPSLAVDAYIGKDMMGVPFSFKDKALSMSYPLVIQGAVESIQQDGIAFGIGATLVPSLFGVGVQTYSTNDFLKQGPDNNIIKLLKDKKALAIEPNDIDRKIYDIETGEERKMTSSEFKKYYEIWANHIKKSLSDNMGEYKNMSADKFEKEFNKIKSQASNLAKESVSNVTQSVKTIKINVNGELETIDLSPEDVKLRIDINEEFKANNSQIFDRQFNKSIRQGKTEYEAEIDANKALERAANEYSKKIMLQMYKEDDTYNFE